MNYTLLKHRSIVDFNNYQSLPFAVYVTHNDGTIISANTAALELLKITEDEIGKINIVDYYEYTQDRLQILKRLESKNDGEWLVNHTVKFNIQKEQINLKFFIKVFREKNFILGALCIVFRITGFETFSQLENNMPVGLFEIGDKENRIKYSNKKFKEILKIDSLGNQEVILKFLFPKEDAETKYKKILSDLKEKSYLQDRIVDLIRNDGKSIVGKFNVVVEEYYPDGKIMSAKGILEDVTYADILEDLPIGLFNLKFVNNQFEVVHCNEFFAKIFANGDINACIGKRLDTLINNELEYKKVFNNVNKLLENNSQSNNLIDSFHLNIDSLTGKKEVMMQIKGLKMRNDIFRFNGVVFDVSNNVDRILFGWKEDIEAFLHTFESMCSSMSLTLRGIMSVHGTKLVVNGRINIEGVKNRLIKHVNAYIKYADLYIDSILNSNFSRSEIQKFTYQSNYYHERLNLVEISGSSKLSMASIRSIFNDLRNTYDEFDKENKLFPSYRKIVLEEITEVLRFSRLISLYNIVEEILEMGAEIKELKEFLKTDTKEIKTVPFDLNVQLNEAINNSEEYAFGKNIKINLKSNHGKAILFGNPRGFYLALINVLNNAIKYSWKKPDDVFSSVNVEIKNDGVSAIISVENRGVGIPNDEIESDSLFELTYRGRYSSDRGRPGTGIGLWHTNKIITEMNGTVTISSKPIDNAHPNDFNKPFLTKVIIKLPLFNV